MDKKYLVSACLAGKPCRYDGCSKPNPEIVKLFKEGKAVLCCPECDGGLATPRVPSERKGSKVINKQGEDVTAFYKKGAQKALELCKEHNIKTAILKSKSPSCGCGLIYDGTFSGRLIPGDGVTAELLKENEIKVMNEDNFNKDEEDL